MSKATCAFIVFLFLLFQCQVTEDKAEMQESVEKVKLRRSESFFGLHFDKHAGEKDSIGITLTKEMIDSMLVAVKPDYIQIDCKGHPGISSYPTGIGFRAAYYEGDPLRLWREVTEKHNVALYMHFSGIHDRKVVAEHPEWATIRADGTRSDRNLSVFSPYDDTYLIPQLKELAGKYGVDGVWVDGECWSYEADYGKEALAEYTRRTGNTSIPRKPEDTGYFEFMEYQRDLFKEHVAHYLKEVHAEYPEFQITSNWAYSSMMPEQVALDLDYMSGDLTPGNAVNRAAFESRCMASQGMPWDLMAWSFSWDPDRQLPNHTKTALQLNQELAEVMAMGGGVQVYFKQNRDISIQPWTIPIMAELAVFCRERQPWCQGTRPVPQIGILYSGYAYKKGLTRVYPSWDPSMAPMIGLNTVLLDGQHCTEILMEHHLEERGSDYPLIAIPEWQVLGDGVKELLLEYTESGGSLLLIGAGPVSYFAKELGIGSVDVTNKNIYIENNDRLFNLKGEMVVMEASPDAIYASPFYALNDLRWPTRNSSVVVQQYGRGKIAMINFNLGKLYMTGSNHVMRDYLSNIVGQLFDDQAVEVTGSHLVHVTLNRKGGALLVNLINVAGSHANDKSLGLDEIPPVGPLEIAVRYDNKPGEIWLQPGHIKLNYTYQNGVIHLVLPVVELYSIIEIK